MEEPTKHTRKLTNEPGRRYVATRIAPLPGAGITKTAAKTAPKPFDVVEPGPPTKLSVQRNPATKPALPRTKRSQVLRRQMVERAQEQRFKTKKKRSKHVLWYGGALVVIGAFLIVAWSFREVLPFHIELFKSEPPAVNSIDSDPHETSTLDEIEVSEADIQAHLVPTDAPRVLRIPKLNIAARVKQVGTTLSNEPIAPKNIADVGWYESSGKPGGEGAVLLNGHLSGPNKAGVFKDVHSLESGDEITLERGDRKILTYIVARVQEYSGGQIDMNAAVNSINPSKKGLNLITTLNKYSGTEKRIIVFALQRD
jgi:sortase (surface protein transpeptidase)